MESMENKVCSKCKQKKPLSEFWRDNARPDGRKSQCKKCSSTYQKLPKALWKRRIYSRAHYAKHKNLRRCRDNAHAHGMTVEEYDSFFAKRNYQCEVCGMTQEESYKLLNQTLSIDHCHETGENKGLLCNLCNPASGMLKDDPDLAFRLWRYLERTRRKEN